MSKGVKILLSVLAVILIVVVTAVVVYITVSNNQPSGDSDVLSIDEMVQFSFDTTEVTTDLRDGAFVRLQFRIITDNEDAFEEITQRDFQVTNIIIKELSVMTTQDFTSDLDALEDTLKLKLNELMTEGEVTDVYTIMKILQ